MKQSILIALMCIGCAKPVPESGIYLVNFSPKVNTCGESHEMGDWPDTESSILVDLENNQVILDDDLLLELDKNEATMDEIIFEQPGEEYTLIFKGEWYIEWSTPTAASGDFGIVVNCEGASCPSSEPGFVDALPCESKLNLEMEMIE